MPATTMNLLKVIAEYNDFLFWMLCSDKIGKRAIMTYFNVSPGFDTIGLSMQGLNL
jgi:hypothetical protein